MKILQNWQSFNEALKLKKYSVVKVGGFEIGNYNTIRMSKKAIKSSEPGFYQIIDNFTGLTIWEGNN